MLDETVAVLGDGSPADLAIVDELSGRGAHPHLVSVDVGWLRPVRTAVARLDSVPGQSAVRGLPHSPVEGVRLVVLGHGGRPTAERSRWERLCRRSGERHDITLIWVTGLPDVRAHACRSGDRSAAGDRPTGERDGDDESQGDGLRRLSSIVVDRLLRLEPGFHVADLDLGGSG